MKSEQSVSQSVIPSVVRQPGIVDDLTDADYRDIYDELRTGHTLRQIIAMSGSGLSASWWSQYEAGAKTLTPRARNDLRRAVGLDELPLPPADLLAEHVEADAAIVRVGDDPQAGRVILLATSEPVTVTWDGDPHSTPLAACYGVTNGAALQSATNTRPSAAKPRRDDRATIRIDKALHAELNAIRQATGESWPQFIARLRTIPPAEFASSDAND